METKTKSALSVFARNLKTLSPDQQTSEFYSLSIISELLRSLHHEPLNADHVRLEEDNNENPPVFGFTILRDLKPYMLLTNALPGSDWIRKNGCKYYLRVESPFCKVYNCTYKDNILSLEILFEFKLSEITEQDINKLAAFSQPALATSTVAETNDLEETFKTLVSQINVRYEEREYKEQLNYVIKELDEVGLADKYVALLQEQVSCMKENQATGWYILGLALVTLEKYDEAIAAFEESESGPISNKHFLYFNWASAYAYKNDYLTAISYHKKAIKIKKFKEAYFNIGFCNTAIGRHKKARDAFESCARVCQSEKKSGKGDLTFWNTWSENYIYNLNDPDKGIEILQEAVKIFPDNKNFFLHYNMSVANYHKADTMFETDDSYFDVIQQAHKYRQKAIKIASIDEEKHYSYQADLHFLAKKLTDALKNSQLAMKENPNSVDINTAHGQILLQLDRTEEAIHFIDDAKSLSKGDIRVLINLAEAYRKQKKFRESYAELKKLIKRDRNNVDAIKGMININIEQAESGEANNLDEMDCAKHFEEAKNCIHRLLNYHTHPEYSRQLSPPEISHFFSLLGYINYKLFEFSESKDTRALTQAIKNYSKVSPKSKYYFESQANMLKLQSHLSKMAKRIDKKRSIMWMGLILILTSFGMIASNFLSKGFQVNPERLKELAATKLIDLGSVQLNNISDELFDNRMDVFRYLDKISNNVSKIVYNDELLLNKHWELSYHERIDNVLILGVLLIAVTLVVVGNVIDEIKSLKLPGGVHLEKDTLESMTKTTNFKINRNN